MFLAFPNSDDVSYMLKELKLQAQQGRDLPTAALFFKATPDQLNAWCLAHTPGNADYNTYAAQLRTRYESDLLMRQQLLAQQGSPVAQRALLGHLRQSARDRERAAKAGVGMHELELESEGPFPSTAVYVGSELIDTALVFSARAVGDYNYRLRKMEWALVLNPGANERIPYANLKVSFTTREARDQAQHSLDQARLANQAGPLELFPTSPS